MGGTADYAIFGTHTYSKNKGLHLQVRKGKYYMGFYDNDCEGSQYVRKKGTWERVAFVYDKATQTQTIVVNGVTVGRCTGRGPFVGTDTVLLGAWAGGRLWKGQIKNVKFFSKALSTEKADMILQQSGTSANTATKVVPTTSNGKQNPVQFKFCSARSR